MISGDGADVGSKRLTRSGVIFAVMREKCALVAVFAKPRSYFSVTIVAGFAHQSWGDRCFRQ